MGQWEEPGIPNEFQTRWLYSEHVSEMSSLALPVADVDIPEPVVMINYKSIVVTIGI